MKFLRLGLTESTILYHYYNQKYHNIKINDKRIVNWLYSTSGFYDKNIKGNYFNFNNEFDKILKSDIFNKYFENLLNILKEDNIKIKLNFHKIFNDEKSIKNKNLFLNKYNYSNKELIDNKKLFYSFLKKSSNLLVVNNLGVLIKKQFDNKNVFKVDSQFPDNIKSLNFYNTIYSFMNNGPDNNIIETSDKIFKNILISIKKYNIDSVVISCGAYSSLFFSKLLDYNINIYVIGGTLCSYFGIKNRRNNLNTDLDYIITVPENLKPNNYKKIENGCYW